LIDEEFATLRFSFNFPILHIFRRRLKAELQTRAHWKPKRIRTPAGPDNRLILENLRRWKGNVADRLDGPECGGLPPPGGGFGLPNAGEGDNGFCAGATSRSFSDHLIEISFCSTRRRMGVLSEIAGTHDPVFVSYTSMRKSISERPGGIEPS
jgi:hypothetical protein